MAVSSARLSGGSVGGGVWERVAGVRRRVAISLSKVLNLSNDILNCSLNAADVAGGIGVVEAEDEGSERCSAGGEASRITTSSAGPAGRAMSTVDAADVGMGRALEGPASAESDMLLP